MNIAYFITEQTKESNILLLKKYYENDNFFTVSNNIRTHTINEIASVNIYYIHFMSGKIIFDNIKDFLSVCDAQNLLPAPILFKEKTSIDDDDRKYLSKFDTILVLNNNKIESVNHETIQ